MCIRSDTIPACDRQTDGRTDRIAVASTALAMQALRRAVKTKFEGRKKQYCNALPSSSLLVQKLSYIGDPFSISRLTVLILLTALSNNCI